MRAWTGRTISAIAVTALLAGCAGAGSPVKPLREGPSVAVRGVNGAGRAIAEASTKTALSLARRKTVFYKLIALEDKMGGGQPLEPDQVDEADRRIGRQVGLSADAVSTIEAEGAASQASHDPWPMPGGSESARLEGPPRA